MILEREDLQNLMREDIRKFFENPVWQLFRTSLFERKEELYAKIIDEKSRVPEVKMCADKLAVIDEIFEAEADLIKTLQNNRGELQ